jgi:hypothetical protein
MKLVTLAALFAALASTSAQADLRQNDYRWPMCHGAERAAAELKKVAENFSQLHKESNCEDAKNEKKCEAIKHAQERMEEEAREIHGKFCHMTR